ncbi:hypothetical protein ACLFKT_47255, partial [Paraburkholderia sp. BR14261]
TSESALPSAAAAAPQIPASATTATTAAAPTAASSPLAPNGAVGQFLPSRFAVHVGTLTLLKRHWENVVLGASRTGERGNEWQANVASNQVSGHVSWKPGAEPGAPGTLEARLARLTETSATENDLLGQA